LYGMLSQMWICTTAEVDRGRPTGRAPPTLVRRDIHGFDCREIGEVAKVPIGTVMSRLARARRRLIAIMAKDEALMAKDEARRI
jgi:hypothetical protein